MQAEHQHRFSPVMAILKDGRRVILRLIAPDDGRALGDFYATLPPATWRFYCPPHLTREDAERTAAWASTLYGSRSGSKSVTSRRSPNTTWN